MNRRVFRLLTEEAVRLVQNTHVEYSDLCSLVPSNTGRMGLRSKGRLGVSGGVATLRQSCWLRLVTIVEAYLDILSVDVFHERVRDPDEITLKLVSAMAISGSRTWTDRKAVFKDYHGVLLTAAQGWPEINAAIEVRNSIAHGLGRLTPTQSRSRAAARMASAGVSVVEGTVDIREDALNALTISCVGFLKSVDTLAG